MASQQDTQSLPPPVHDCLKLLKSATDHQRLAGLDIVTQYRKANDLSSLHTIYHALPPHFLHQLLRHRPRLLLPRSPNRSRKRHHLQDPTPSDKGATTLFNSAGFIKSLASHIQILPELVAIKLVQGLLSKVVFLDVYLAELAVIVATLARHFACCTMLSTAEKLEALVLAEAMVRIFGEGWLIGEVDNVGELDGKEEHAPADRCLLLVLEQLRVEVGVVLNALAYLRNEANKNLGSSLTGETVCSKQRNVAVLFSLVEKIINLMSNAVAKQASYKYLIIGCEIKVGKRNAG
ncbi:hypothetical protein ACLB2K_062873 [Fragaria x ananassa]